MKTKILISILVSFLVVSVVSASILIPGDEKGREKGKGPENAPVIERIDDHWILKPSGLERLVIIHYERPGGKPDKPGKQPKEDGPTCYGFLGAKWKNLEGNPVSYVVDPSFSGLTDDSVATAAFLGAEEWDDWTSAELFSDGSPEVVGDGSWDTDSPDGRNELVFADYKQDGVIAVTVIWGYFRGKPSNRRIIEFDILFDVDYTWGDAGDTDEEDLGNTSVMDLQNIAIHELGHGVGLDDLYEDACSEVTMYGYSEEGETKKRTLEGPDITAIQELYGGPE